MSSMPTNKPVFMIIRKDKQQSTPVRLITFLSWELLCV